MATFDVGLSAAGYFLRLTVTEISVDVPNNRSTVSWSVAVHKGSGSGKYSGYVSYWSVNIGGVGASGSRASYDFRPVGAGVGIVWGSGSTTLDHNPDGTLTIGVSGSFSESVALIGNGTASGSLALTTIPRASTPTFSPNPCDAGTVLTITSNRASGTFTHEMDYSIGAASGSIGTGIGASTTWTPPLSLVNQLPNSTTGLVNVTTRTYSGATLIGTTVTSFTLAVPASVVPDFGTITNSEGTAGVAAAVGAYVQGVSKLVLAITSAVGAYSSTISSYKIEVSGQTINAVSGTTPLPIATSGTVAIVGTVTDSRGRTHSETVNVTVLAYAPPVIDAPFFLTRRSDVAGVLAEEGTSIRVDLKAAVQSLLVAAVQKNTISFKIYTRLRDTTTWTLKDTVTPAGITYNSYRVISTYAINSSWEVRVDVYDKFATSSIISTVPTSTIFMEWAPGGFLGLGKYYEAGRGQMDALGELYANDGAKVLNFDDFADNTETITGTAVDVVVTPAGLLASLTARPPARNLLCNATFRVNQRLAASGASLASGAFFLDRWKSNTASNAVTWTGSDATGRVLTIPASKSIIQIIEQADVLADNYMLVWSGTADLRAYKVGATPPSYNTTGAVVVTLDGTGNVTVEATNGTLTWVALVRVDAWTGFFPDVSFAEDLAQCQRYYWRLAPVNSVLCALAWFGTTAAYGVIPYPVPMRAAPTMAVSGQTGAHILPVVAGSSTTVSAIVFAQTNERFTRIGLTTSSIPTGTAGWSEIIAGAWIEGSADL